MTSRGRGSTGSRDRLTNAWHGELVRGVDFSGADLTSLSGPGMLRLDRCSFGDADLRHATLDGWQLKLCNLTGANLRGASLRGTWFAACDLTGADLRDTDLFDARFGDLGLGEDAIRTCLDGTLFDTHG